MSIKPTNFVRQCYEDRRDTGGMFDAEVGVQEVTTTGSNRFRAYVSDWHGGVQCFRDTEAEARAEIERLMEVKFG
jgi:hypothetical protein